MFQFMMFTFLKNAMNLCIFTYAPGPPLKTAGRIFWKSVSPKAEVVDETMILSIKIQSENMKLTCNTSLLTFYMICNFSKCDSFTILQISIT